jgi:hypothetical protein
MPFRIVNYSGTTSALQLRQARQALNLGLKIPAAGGGGLLVFCAIFKIKFFLFQEIQRSLLLFHPVLKSNKRPDPPVT